MDTSLGSLHVAAATVSVLDCFSVMFWVVMFDMVIAPYFVKIGRPISLLQRIGKSAPGAGKGESSQA